MNISLAMSTEYVIKTLPVNEGGEKQKTKPISHYPEQKGNMKQKGMMHALAHGGTYCTPQED